MSVGFTRNDIAGDIAEGLRAEQGDGYQNAVQYQIQDFAGHSLNTSGNWFGCKNLPDIYNWLTLVALYGPDFANRSLSRLGLKVVPIGADEADQAKWLEAEAMLLEDMAARHRRRAGAAGVKLKAVK